MSHRPFVAVAVIFVAACGAQVSLEPGTAPARHDGGGVLVPAPVDASVEDAGSVGYPGLLGAADAARVCGANAIAALPMNYAVGAASFAADSLGMIFDLLPQSGGNVGMLAAADPLGVFTTLATFPGGALDGASIVMDTGSAYFFGSAGTSTSLYSIARGGGAPVALASLGAGGYGEIALGATDLWINVIDAGGASSLYDVPKTGAFGLGAPAYTAPPGSRIESIVFDGTTLSWAEVAPPSQDAGANVAIRSATVGGALAPTTYATFAAGENIRIAEVSGTMFFAFDSLPVHPIPPPPPEDAAPQPAGPQAGLYSIAAGGAPVLVDPKAGTPLRPSGGALYYRTVGYPLFGAIERLVPGAASPVTIVPPGTDLRAFAVGSAVDYVLGDGCVYAASYFGP